MVGRSPLKDLRIGRAVSSLPRNGLEGPCWQRTIRPAEALLAVTRIRFNANHLRVKNLHRLADQWILFQVPPHLATRLGNRRGLVGFFLLEQFKRDLNCLPRYISQ